MWKCRLNQLPLTSNRLFIFLSTSPSNLPGIHTVSHFHLWRPLHLCLASASRQLLARFFYYRPSLTFAAYLFCSMSLAVLPGLVLPGLYAPCQCFFAIGYFLSFVVACCLVICSCLFTLLIQMTAWNHRLSSHFQNQTYNRWYNRRARIRLSFNAVARRK